MLRMTRQADYAIVLLTYFADHRGIVLTARDLAAQVHLPVPMVSKILKALAREGLLQSTRGAHGGYRLDRAAEEISVAEIVTAIEGPIAITECTSDAPANCDIAAMCAVRANWQTINQVVRDALGGISLAQMTSPINPGTTHGRRGTPKSDTSAAVAETEPSIGSK